MILLWVKRWRDAGRFDDGRLMSGSKTYKTEAIVLKHANLGEADRILTLYTSKAGKIRAVAKGARKTTSRLGGHVEPLTHCSLMLTHGQQMDTVNQGETIESFPSIRNNLRLTAQALYMVELIDAFASERVENYPVYKLLLEALHHLGGKCHVPLLFRYFELQLVGHVGYQPQLGECLNCHSPLKPVENSFSSSGGGVLCPNCTNSEPIVQPISVNTLKVLRLLQRGDYAMASRLRLNSDLSKELERLMQGYVRYLLEREIKSTRFLNRLDREEIAKSSG
ncbi:MAG: DNA repair protein RecO [Dehalococcoidia bacterium]|nr:DNA repair protein RecO [Dehalococcoidia bacterium]